MRGENIQTKRDVKHLDGMERKTRDLPLITRYVEFDAIKMPNKNEMKIKIARESRDHLNACRAD